MERRNGWAQQKKIAKAKKENWKKREAQYGAGSIDFRRRSEATGRPEPESEPRGLNERT